MRFCKIYIGCIIALSFCQEVQGQPGWTQKANFPGAARNLGAAFSIGNYGYIGCGWNGTYYNDFYKWSQVTNTWTAVANYPGVGLYSPTSFAINGKGYVGFGVTVTNAMATDLWRYDPVTNAWTQMATFPAMGWYDVDCFVIGHKCYCICGSNGGPPYNPSVWMYDANANTWTQKANFPGGNVEGTLAFSIGKNGYAGCGWDGGTYHSAMWEYDTTNDTWTPIAPIPARAPGVTNARQFVIGSKAYVCVGRDGANKAMPDGLVYDTVTKVWCQFSDLGIIARGYGASFAINNKGYVGIGTDTNGNYTGPWVNTYYEYDPSSLSSYTVKDTVGLCSNDTAHFYGVTLFDSTESAVTWKWIFTGGIPATSNAQNPIVIFSTSGIHKVELIVSTCGGTDTIIKNIHITTGSSVITSFSGNTIICTGQSTTLNMSGGISYLWSPGNNTNSSITVNPASTTTYTVAVSNGTCVKDTAITVTVNTKVPITLRDTEICIGRSVFFKCDSGNYGYQWSPVNSLSKSDIYNPIATPTVTTEYKLVLTNGTCVSIDSALVTVKPLPRIKADPDSSMIIYGESVQFTVSGDTGNTWWTPEQWLSCTDCITTVAKPDSNMVYYVHVGDSHGCSATDSVIVDVAPTIYIPDAFTPNGDGRNDVFSPETMGCVAIDATIFNRWGQLIYHWNKLNGGWDGTFSNNNAQEDIYVYVINITDRYKKKHTYIGKVNLLR